MEATLTVKLPDALRQQVRSVAAQRGQTLSEIVRRALQQYVEDAKVERKAPTAMYAEIAEQDQELAQADLGQHEHVLAQEQAAWYALEARVRQRYAGEYVAVRGGQVVDHDADQRALYLRVRARFGHSPVLIVHADWSEPPVYTIHSPHLE